MKSFLLAAALLLAPVTAWAEDAFVPGDVVLFQEDFTAPEAKGFKRLQAVSPRIGLAVRDRRPFVHILTPGRFDVPLPASLPQRFTIEFEVFVPGENYVLVGAAGKGAMADGTAIAYFSPNSLSYSDGGSDGKIVEADEFPGGEERQTRVMRLALAVDGAKARMFVDGVQRLEADAPPFLRTRGLHFEFGGVEDPTLLDQNVPMWISNIRVAGFTEAAK